MVGGGFLVETCLGPQGANHVSDVGRQVGLHTTKVA